MTKLESDSNSADDQLTLGASECENFTELNGAVTDLLSAQARSPLNTSEFSLSGQSSADITSLTDHCLTVEITMMNSPQHNEPADDVDRHSGLSTPPLHPDSDTDSALRASEIIFPSKVDNLFISQSLSSEQLQRHNVFDNCSKTIIGDGGAINSGADDAINSTADSAINSGADDVDDAISKQLYMDVNSLLGLSEDEASKNKDEVHSCERRLCSATDDADQFATVLPAADQFGCGTVLPAAVDNLTDATSSAGTCDIMSETVSGTKADLDNSRNADAVNSQNCDKALPTETFSLSLQECFTETISECDQELKNSALLIAECVDDMASECRPEDMASECRPEDLASEYRPEDLASEYRPEDLASECRPEDLASECRPEDLASECRPEDMASEYRPEDMASECRPEDLASECRPEDLASECRPEDLASECRPELPTGQNVSGACDLGTITPKVENIEPDTSDMLCDTSKHDDNFVTNLASLSSSIVNNKDTAQLLSDSKGNDAQGGGPVDVGWTALPGSMGKKEESMYDQLDECKPFPTITVSEPRTIADDTAFLTITISEPRTVADDTAFPTITISEPRTIADDTAFPTITISEPRTVADDTAFPTITISEPRTIADDTAFPTITISEPRTIADDTAFPTITISEPRTIADDTGLWTSDGSGSVGALSLKTEGSEAVMPSIASFSSSSTSDGWSVDETWLPDWKLQQTAVVRLERLVLPLNQHFAASKFSVSSENKAPSSKLQLLSGQTSTPGKLVSIQPLLSKMIPQEALVKSESLPVTSTVSSSETSATSTEMDDIPAEDLQREKHTNTLPLSVSVTNATPLTLSLNQPSSSVASNQQKQFSYMDYCNTAQFQPVVRLVRLPLQFFHMLQQTSRRATSSVSLSDLPKRFVTLVYI